MLSVVHLSESVPYERGLELQSKAAEDLLAGKGPETLLLLEHEPVYTIGRLRDQSSLGPSPQLPHPVHETNRGGQATYHGPGQLVGYPVLDLQQRGRDLHRHLRVLEELLISLCEEFGVNARRRDGLTGVWVGDRKVASIGVGVRKWISLHGFAINIRETCLPPFSFITPCGLQGVAMTTLETEAGRPLSMEQAFQSLARLAPGFLKLPKA